MHYYVVGVNGSGKTTLLKAIHEKIGIQVVQGTAELMNWLGIPGDYDALRKMDQADVLNEWGETAAHLLQEYKNEDFLLDTHILNLTHGKIIPRDGPWIADYGALILIKARPATLLNRIAADANKDRAMFTSEMDEATKLKMLDNYQNETQKLFTELSETYGLPSLVIENEKALEDSVQSFINFHQTMS